MAFPTNQYKINSRILTDFPRSKSIWKTLTVGGQRCYIRQFSDINLTAVRVWYRILQLTYLLEKARIFQHTKLYTVWLVAVQLFTSFCQRTERTDCTYGYLNWFRRFCWKRTAEMKHRKILFSLRINIRKRMIERSHMVLEPRSL